MISKNKLLVLAFLLFIALRLVPLFSVYGVPGWDVYYHARTADSFKETGSPFLEEELFVGGRGIGYPVGYPILLGFISWVTGLQTPLVGVLVSLVSAAFLFLLTYMIADRLFGKEAGLISTLLLCGSMSFLEYTGVNPQPTSLSMLFFLSALLAFDLKKRFLCIFSCGLCALTHLSSLLWALAFIPVYPLASLVIFVVSLPFLGFLDASQNLPTYIVSSAFQYPSFDLFFRLGLPLVFATVFFFVSKGKISKRPLETALVSGAALSFVGIFAHTIEYGRGLAFLSLCLALIVSKNFPRKLVPLLFVYPVLFMIWYPIPDMLVLSQEKMELLEWIKTNPEVETVVALEGHWITYFSGKKVVYDGYNLGVKDSERRFGLIVGSYVPGENYSKDLAFYNVTHLLYFNDTIWWPQDPGENPFLYYVYSNPHGFILEVNQSLVKQTNLG